jgi:type I restriction enzyme S subunit
VKHPAYPRTKPSGVEWLGDVPEHWETRKFSREVMIAEGQVDPEKEPYLSMLLVGPEHVESGTGRLLGQVTAAEQAAESGKYYCRQGDVIYSKIRPALRKLVIAPTDCLCSADMYPLRARQRLQNEFIYWLFLSQSFAAWSVLESDRVAMPKINRDTINELRMPVPPKAEQSAIAAFLDLETGRVDRLVAKKRELIERLKEKRTALISRTVTRGLPPAAARAAGLPANPPLKPSDLDWLGDIPKHWEALTVRRRAIRIQTGGTPPTAEERFYEDGTVPWFGPGSFDDQIVVSEPIKLLNASAVKEGAARMFAAGATMVVTIGATLGKVSSLTEAGSCNQQITVIEFDHRRIHPRFATYQLKRLEPALRAIAPSATLPILDQGEIADIALGVPPLPEQAAIAAYLDMETAKLDALVGKVEEAVERLQEYRTALITAAVTGKIDVRKEIEP